jgi:hypothetical protein
VTKKTKKKTAPPVAKKTSSDKRIYLGLGALVIGLGALVVWSLPGDHGASGGEPGDEAGAADLLGDGAAPIAPVEWPPEATLVLSVLARKSDDVVRKLASVTEIEKRLGARHCGDAAACGAVRKFLEGEDDFEVEVVKTDELLLPPGDTMDVVASGLTPKERDEARALPTAVQVRTRGKFAPEQLPARAGFAAAAVLAEALDGFVYDEATRRLETTPEVMAHTTTAPLGEPAFVPRQVVVQLFRDEEGRSHVRTLGMLRYACPDLSIQGARMAAGPVLADVLDAAARKLVAVGPPPPGHEPERGQPISVTLEDVARVTGRKPTDLHPAEATASTRAASLVVVGGAPEPTEGDADGSLAELRPAGHTDAEVDDGHAHLGEAWDGVLTGLFGTSRSTAVPEDDPELGAIAKNARKTLPTAVRRWTGGEGELFLKGPFTVPPEARVDGGATTELLWLAAASCDDRRCTGALSNEPAYVSNLAAGKTTSLERAEVADWLLRQRDGGTVGGDSIKLLRGRAGR